MARVLDPASAAGAVIALFCLVVAPAVAGAEGLAGYLEYGYNRTEARTQPIGEDETHYTGETLLQRYNLSLDHSFYPQLRFNGGVLLEKSSSSLAADSDEIDSDVSKISPRADLSLGSTNLSAGIGYNRTQESSDTSRTPRFDDIRDSYNARFSLLPQLLPSLDLHAFRTNAFDKDREFQDRTSDALTLLSQYKPGSDLELFYLGQYTDTADRIVEQETTTLLNNGRITYGRNFLDNRLSISTTYNIAYQENRIARTGDAGRILNPTPVPPTGLFLRGGNLLFGSLSPDSPAPLLTDNNPEIGDPDAQEQFRIGAFIPATVDTTVPLSFGLNLSQPARVNTLLVTVNQDLAQEFAAPDNLFTWRIFVSDNNTDWVETAIGYVHATYHRFAVVAGAVTFDHGYELNFPEVTTRYLKVVVTPPPAFPLRITPGSNEIYVTELQAFLAEDLAARPQETISFLSQLFDANGRLQLLETPDLFYELNFSAQESRSDLFKTSRHLLSNGLSAAHRFNEVFSGTARIAHEDVTDSQGHQWGFAYSAALNAVPLATLNHALVFSGRYDQTSGGDTNTNGVYLTNTAVLYRGIDVNLGGGYSQAKAEGGEVLKTSALTGGAVFVPHRIVTFGANYNATSTRRTGGGLPDTSFDSRRSELTVTLIPATSLYLTGALAVLSESDRPTVTTRNLGGSWGLLWDGTLLANFAYSESYNSESRQLDRSFVPNLRWNIRRGSYVDLSYLLAHNSSDFAHTKSQTFSATLRMAF